jgi:uncharacterized membrane protein YbaN (DUF454 family)
MVDELGADEGTEPRVVSRLRRVVLVAVGLLCVVVGGIGVVVPGLPSTVFFIAAAWCFARSNPRLEAWVLGLPKIGQMVRSARAGEGMPRSAKRAAIASIIVFSTIAVIVIDTTWLRITIGVLALIGVAVVARLRVRADPLTPERGSAR